MKNIFIVLGIAFWLFSCKQKESPDGVLAISINERQEFPIQELLAEIKLHPLDVTDEFLISDIDKIIKRDTTYYLLDQRMKTLLCFPTKEFRWQNLLMWVWHRTNIPISKTLI